MLGSLWHEVVLCHWSYMRELKGIMETPEGCRVHFMGRKVKEAS